MAKKIKKITLKQSAIEINITKNIKFSSGLCVEWFLDYCFNVNLEYGVFFVCVCVFSGFNLLFEDKRLNSYVIPGLEIKPCSQSARQILSPICSVFLPPLP